MSQHSIIIWVTADGLAMRIIILYVECVSIDPEYNLSIISRPRRIRRSSCLCTTLSGAARWGCLTSYQVPQNSNNKLRLVNLLMTNK